MQEMMKSMMPGGEMPDMAEMQRKLLHPFLVTLSHLEFPEMMQQMGMGGGMGRGGGMPDMSQMMRMMGMGR